MAFTSTIVTSQARTFKCEQQLAHGAPITSVMSHQGDIVFRFNGNRWSNMENDGGYYPEDFMSELRGSTEDMRLLAHALLAEAAAVDAQRALEDFQHAEQMPAEEAV